MADEKKVATGAQIYPLIGQAMRRLSAVAKDSKNETQGFMYRGIDAVMNALYPVMSELGLFFVPEVLEQTREERTVTKKVWDADEKKRVEKKSTLLYSLLKIRYTMYAPDGSNVSAVVIGEGMDSGDKASNKAMAVGLKYAAFQLFMIPTEEMKNDDPDRVTHEVDPKAYAYAPTGAGAAADIMEIERRAQTATNVNPPAHVEKTGKLPDINPVVQYIAKEREQMRITREMNKPEHNALFKAQYEALVKGGVIPAKKYEEMTQAEAETMIDAMYRNFTSPTSTELKA